MTDIVEYEDDKDKWMENFQSSRPDLFFPEEWSSEDKAEAAEVVRPSKTKSSMFSSIPMRCQAAKCTFADTCPLMKKNLAPEGDPCPLEMSMLVQFTNDYIDNLNVDPGDLTEVSMVRNLVDQEIQYLRKTKLLAKEDFIQENIIGITDDGEPIMRKELHLAVDLEDRLHKRMKDLRSQLLLTREAKAKVGQGNLDTAAAIARAATQIAEADQKAQEAIRRSLGTEHQDEYILEDSGVIDAEIIEDE